MEKALDYSSSGGEEKEREAEKENEWEEEKDNEDEDEDEGDYDSGDSYSRGVDEDEERGRDTTGQRFVHPDCVDAAAPFHHCTGFCLGKVAAGKGLPFIPPSELVSHKRIRSPKERSLAAPLRRMGFLKRSKREKKRSAAAVDCWRDWAELPAIALSMVFQRAGAITVLCSAQVVCKSWKKVAEDPFTWRKIDFTIGFWDLWDEDEVFMRMYKVAVDRSAGQLEEFAVEFDYGNNELLLYIAERNNKLRRLHLISCYNITEEGLSEAAKGFPLLEELWIQFFYFDAEEVIHSIGRSCPLLKIFHLNQNGLRDAEFMDNGIALAIAWNLPKLQHLQIFGDDLSNEGLHAILDRCLRLESLDLRQCFKVKMDEKLMKKCSKIGNLKLPDDPTDDFPFSS